MADLTDLTDLSGYSSIFDGSNVADSSTPTDWSYNWAPDAGSYDAATQGIDYAPADYSTYFGDVGAVDPNQYQSYADQWFAPVSYTDQPAYGPGVAFGGGDVSQNADDFTGPLREQDLSMWDKAKGMAYGAENWTDKHKGLTSTGVGALSLLTSIANAKKQAKYQKEALDRAEAEKAARDAKTAAYNAPWVATTPRSRITAVTGPTVADRYGISSRGSSSVNTPSNYDYFTRNAVHLARGGLSQVRGNTGGQADKVPAMLSDGEYVFDADAVSALGDGNNDAGAAKLDQMRESIRAHKRSAPPSRIPPKAKAPMAYLKGRK